MSKKSSDRAEVLVGKSFHTFDTPRGFVGRRVELQGEVLSVVEEHADSRDTRYLVAYYEWLAGSYTHEEVVTLQEMSDWFFYSSNEEMVHSYNHGVVSGMKYQPES